MHIPYNQSYTIIHRKYIQHIHIFWGASVQNRLCWETGACTMYLGFLQMFVVGVASVLFWIAAWGRSRTCQIILARSAKRSTALPSSWLGRYAPFFCGETMQYVEKIHVTVAWLICSQHTTLKSHAAPFDWRLTRPDRLQLHGTVFSATKTTKSLWFDRVQVGWCLRNPTRFAHWHAN